MPGRVPARLGGKVRERERRLNVSGTDKLSNKAEELQGKAKEGVGSATGNEQLEAEGKADQTTGNVKQAGEKIKDVFR